MATLVKQEMVPVGAGGASVVKGGGQGLFGSVVYLQCVLAPSVSGEAGVPPQSQSVRREE